MDRAPKTSAGKPRKDNVKVRNFWKINEATAKQLKDKTYPVLRAVKPDRVIKLPVLFWNHNHDEKFRDVTAFTPDLANGLLLGKTFLMPKPFALRIKPEDPNSAWLFEREAGKQFPKEYAPRYVDDWFPFHTKHGEVHCSSFIVREPKSGKPYWWQKP
jgi:hypothetical protein